MPCNVKTSIPPQLSPTIEATFYLLKFELFSPFWSLCCDSQQHLLVPLEESLRQTALFSHCPIQHLLRNLSYQPCRRYLLLSTRAAIPGKEVSLLEFLLVHLQLVRLTDTSILSSLFAAHAPRKLNEAFAKAFPCCGLVIVTIKGLRVHISISPFQSLSFDSRHENRTSLLTLSFFRISEEILASH